ncbi:MAG TPA: dienelactone hydrolase family protein [Candidatus Binatia bacterium]|nr:dienelactone hydrolase family protein [Candidatus Binatia bacterium]
MQTAWEQVTVDNSPMGLYVAQPEGQGPFPAILVIQNKDGVKEFTQQMTHRVAEAGYVGVAPQLYHREGEPKTEEETEHLKEFRRDTHVLSDITATLEYLRGCANIDTSRLGIVGFCMGGRVAFLMAAASKSFKAAVDFYGGGVYSKWGIDRPAPVQLLSDISCPIQGHFGELDTNPPPEEMRVLDTELHRLGKKHEFFFYPDSAHGFNRSDGKAYKPEHDATSWGRTLEFFARHLAQAPRKKAAAG